MDRFIRNVTVATVSSQETRIECGQQSSRDTGDLSNGSMVTSKSIENQATIGTRGGTMSIEGLKESVWVKG